jgi:predicted transcriptional regulator
MNATRAIKPAFPLIMRALKAADLMTPNPLSLQDTLTVREAVGIFVDRGISGAPVIDDAGRPIGVLTQTDVLIHDRSTVEHLVPEVERAGPHSRKAWDGFQVEKVDPTPIRDLMTPAVFSIGLDAPAWRVIEELRELNVHRLFVVDANGVLVGVITALDVLRHLHRPEDQ